jgi:MFS family permease
MEESRENPNLRRAESRTSLEAFNWNAGLRSFYDTTCGGSLFIFVAFALSLGLAKERVGLITSVVSFACLLQVVTVAAIHFIPDTKRFILALGLCEPLVLMATALATPFLPAGLRLWALGAGIFLAGAAYHLMRPLADDWLASSIPVGIRARYLGRRFQVISACTIAAMLLAGYVAERIAKSDSFGLGLALVGGGVFGALAVLALWRAPMPAQSSLVRVTWKDAREAFRVRPFRNYLIMVFIFELPFLMAVPYYQVFNLKVLHMKESRIAYMTIGYLVVKLLVTGFCGRFIHRHGVRRAIWATGPLYALFLLSFLFCTPERTWPLFAAWAIVGVADAAFSIAATMALYDSVPETPGRPIYFAIANVLSIGMFCVGGAAAIPILEGLRDATVQIGPFALGQFHCLYAICFILMIPATCGAAFLPARKKELAWKLFHN